MFILEAIIVGYIGGRVFFCALIKLLKHCSVNFDSD